MGFGLAGIGLSVMHDANHGAYAKKAWVNDLIGYSVNLLGVTAFTWKIQHNVLHHTYTNVHEEDEDISPRGALRFSPHSEWKKMHHWQSGDLPLGERCAPIGREAFDVKPLIESINHLFARVEQALESEKRFTADAAHELRTPLAMLASQVDVVLERPRSATHYQEALANMREDISRMNALLSEMLTLRLSVRSGNSAAANRSEANAKKICC
jgi:signal transduction histidine kinase